MYQIFLSVIQSGGYDDLNGMLSRLRSAWARGILSESELDELEALARDRAPVKRYDVQAEIDRLWAAVRDLQTAQAAQAKPAVDEPDAPVPETAPEFVQPTGAHDAYRAGDRVTYGDAVYVSLIDGNVWAPDVYPAGWQREEAAEE